MKYIAVIALSLFGPSNIFAHSINPYYEHYHEQKSYSKGYSTWYPYQQGNKYYMSKYELKEVWDVFYYWVSQENNIYTFYFEMGPRKHKKKKTLWVRTKGPLKISKEQYNRRKNN